jgi:hypothetical protein
VYYVPEDGAPSRIWPFSNLEPYDVVVDFGFEIVDDCIRMALSKLVNSFVESLAVFVSPHHF